MSDRPESLAARIAAQKPPSKLFAFPTPVLEEPVSDTAFSTINAASGQRQIMLDLRKKDGTALGLSYAYMHSVTFHPSNGIVLSFSGQRIELTGLRLEPLYRALLVHHVASIIEVDAFQASVSSEATIVTNIKII